MKLVLKLALYLGLLIAAVVCFGKFRNSYRQAPVLNRAELNAAAGDTSATSDTAPTEAAATAVTNAPATVTNATETADAVTNLVTTNAVEKATAAVKKPTSSKAPEKPAAEKSSAFMFLGLFVACLVLMAALGAWDFTQYLGNRAERAMMASDFELPSDPDYEAAEQEWSKGNHLDAINLMREYLTRNPSEQHAAIRIAEIYEKDLNNYLAAALELEEVLTKKLPREKWGWTAIHLANLYSGKLNQPPKALAVLERITRDYPDTAAAKKARQRLGLPEPTTTAPAPAEPALPEAPAEDPASANLPKGFRAKK
jgi:TolA-binding protein